MKDKSDTLFKIAYIGQMSASLSKRDKEGDRPLDSPGQFWQDPGGNWGLFGEKLLFGFPEQNFFRGRGNYFDGALEQFLACLMLICYSYG